MLKKIKEFFTGKPATEVETATAPYKVPEPSATTPIPLVVTNSNPADNVPVVEAAPAKKATKAKAPAKPKAPKAPVAPKAPKAPAAKKPAVKKV